MQGYIYPNEYELQWSLLIVLYPYITGLVAGAFILASLERVFNVREVRPTYRLALLTALAFLLVAPLPLQAHLGHPERSYEILITPNRNSAMAMFGFVYAWYLMVVLLLEIWFEYRKDLVIWARSERGFKRLLHRVLTLGATDLSERSLRFDDSAGRWITIIGIPSAFLLHGYVGFIFGSVKANPWWSSVLMPVVFICSAIVSGIALVLILYTLSSLIRSKPVDMPCLDKLGGFLFYAMVVDLSLELLDFVHRLYESEESIDILSQMIQSRLFISLIVLQLVLGSLVPLVMLGLTSPVLRKSPFLKVSDELKRLIFVGAAILVEVGIFSIRWNVVIGGQLFSKSLRGLTVYKVELLGLEGLAMTAAILILPFILLWLLVKVLPPWLEAEASVGEGDELSTALGGTRAEVTGQAHIAP
jgi:Ni/Fe-hydrogenase subunit HybB-like protein